MYGINEDSDFHFLAVSRGGYIFVLTTIGNHEPSYIPWMSSLLRSPALAIDQPNLAPLVLLPRNPALDAKLNDRR